MRMWTGLFVINFRLLPHTRRDSSRLLQILIKSQSEKQSIVHFEQIFRGASPLWDLVGKLPGPVAESFFPINIR